MELVDGKYYIDGIDVLDLADRYGCPFYVYNTSKIKEQYDRLKNAVTYPKFKIKSVFIALIKTSIIIFFIKLIAKLDVVSVQKVRLGIKGGFKQERKTYIPKCLGIEKLKKLKDCYVIFKKEILSKLEKYGSEFSRASVYIRLSPYISSGGISIRSKAYILAYQNVKDYCMVIPSNYYSPLCLTKVLISKKKDCLIRKIETMEDNVRNQIEIDL
jgi:diaminopimelate decarboxylase